MNRKEPWSLLTVITLGFLLGLLAFFWDKMPSQVERVAWSPEAQWIAPPQPSYRFYTRRTFYLADTVQAAWLRLSADNDFILYINGRVVARENSILVSSEGLASKLRPHQGFSNSLSYSIPSFPEYWMANARDWKLTDYVDLTPYLHPGKNTIALEIQKSQENPRVVVEGAIYPVPDAPPIDLTTGVTPWQVSTLFETHQQIQWFDSEFPVENWPEAKAIGPVREATYTRLSQHLFGRLLQGTWITGAESSQGEVWLRSQWQVPKTRQRAFVRLVGDGNYTLLINGLLVNRYRADVDNELHMYEVTNLLKTGLNTLAVRLARPLDRQTAAQNGPLRFFLDGWVEAQDSITAPIATDSTWTTLTQPLPGWAEGLGQGQPATSLGPPEPQFQRRFEGNAYLLNYPDSLWHTSLWCLAGIGCASLYAWVLGRFWLGQANGWDSFSAGAGLLLPGTLFLIGIGLLKHRYAEAEQCFLFIQPQSTPLVFLGFVGTELLTLLWNQQFQPQRSYSLKPLSHGGLWFLLGLIAFIGLGLLGGLVSGAARVLFVSLSCCGIVVLMLQNHVWTSRYWFKTILHTWPAWGQCFLLVSIIGIGFGLRAYSLGFVDLDADENTSFDPIRGILRTGVPEAASHIWYTRGPLYHYMVALWLKLVGNSAVNARFLSVLWGTATLVLVFIFTRKITGKVWVALVVTAILAIDPWELWYSRYIRFYQAMQCLSLLTFWLFFKGFIDREGRVYQYCFFIALTLTMLNQEVTITLLPCFLIGFLFFYRPFRLVVDWPIVASSFLTVGIISYDIIFFSIKCLTPLVALSNSTASYLKLHLSDVAVFASVFFVGPSRAYTIYSFFFFMGFIYFLKRRNGKIVFLFSSIFLTLIVLTILLYQVAPRYTYSIYPLFIILSVHSAVCLTESIGRRFEFILKTSLPLKNVALGCLIMLLISNIDLGRVVAGYQTAFNKRNTHTYEYIRTHRQPGDVVISATPFPAAIVLGGLDYYLMPAFRSSADFPFDTVYWHEGQVIERWAGGIVVSNLDQMLHVLEKANRVWLLLDDNKLEGEAVAPELSNYMQTLGKPMMETFGSRLRLWQRDDGLLPRVPSQGRDLGVY